MPKSNDQNASAIAVIGSGGSGAVTAGLILLNAAARAGYYGLLTRSAGPQIRGGESAAMIRFSRRPVRCMGDRFDILVALDWGNHTRFRDEIPIDGDSLVLADTGTHPVPAMVADSGAELRDGRFQQLASMQDEGRANMIAVGAAGAALGLPLESLVEGAAATLKGKGQAVLGSAQRCIRDGYGSGPGGAPATSAPAGHCQRWNISGNEASGLGALRGGVRFVAAYPITPASEMLEWLAPRLERLGGALLQAEDELASINMIIGGSFGGVPSLTATSGPGLSLMLEGIGLAIASETPVVVANVMRGGPSTGIPTKTEQSDLDIALYGCHGDAPHLVLGALSIADCVFTTAWSTQLAEHLQTAAIVLSDQLIGQSRAIIDPPPAPDLGPGRVLASDARGAQSQPYQRYAAGADGISPMSIPGRCGASYTADGLEHNAAGTPSSLAADHRAQLDKRRRKLVEFDYGDAWAEIDGEGPLCIVTWGSTHGVVSEASERLRQRGRPTRVIGLRLLAPLQHTALREAIGEARVIVVEQNHSAQLFRYLHAQRALPLHAHSLARPGPLPLRPDEIVTAAEEV